ELLADCSREDKSHRLESNIVGFRPRLHVDICQRTTSRHSSRSSVSSTVEVEGVEQSGAFEMNLWRKQIAVSKATHRMAWSFCILGVWCATWEVGRQWGSLKAMHTTARKAATEEGVTCGSRQFPCVESEDVHVGGVEVVVPAEKSPIAPPMGSPILSAEEGWGRHTSAERLPVAEEQIPAEEPSTFSAEGDTDRLHPDLFWKAYAADRYSLLTRGVVVGTEDKDENGTPPSAGASSRVRPTKYLVFSNTVHGLGNHMAGMMSAFVMSIATERVFLHDWVEPRDQVAARYDDIFVPPFTPWDTSAATGTRVSGPEDLLTDAGGLGGGPAVRAAAGSSRERWAKPPEMSSAEEKERCTLDFKPTAGGVQKGHFNAVFLKKRGQDPRPKCPVLYVSSNQFLVEFMSSPAFGSSKVGGTLISEWLRAGRASQTLFPGLFRPVAAVRQRIADESARLFPVEGQTIAAHARSFHLGSVPRNNKFVGCLQQLALSKNISTVLLVTDMDHFEQFAASKLRPRGINVVTMNGVERSGEGRKMRNSLQKIQLALTEMMLVGNADIAVTSPRSSYSALAAARGGTSTQRFGEQPL
ncbi:unnamed protein product, partial [Ectocarpus fasciculatus]